MRTLSRRTLLRGMLGGAVVSIALPPLDIFFDSHGVAYAADGGFPRRFGLFFWGNGMLPERWTPPTTGSGWTPSDQLAPLANLTDVVSVVSGMEVKIANMQAHGSGPAGFLSGTDLKVKGDDSSFLAPSLDQQLAAVIGGDTIYRSVEAGISPGVKGLSYNGADSVNPPESDPKELFQRLFGPHFTAPGETPVIDPRLALRRSVLDAVLDDAKRLEKRLGVGDKQRLDQHLSAIYDLEQRLFKLESDPPSFEGCDRPEEPPALPDIDGRPQMTARAEVVAELIAMAFACDLTRVASVWHSDPVGDVLYPDATAGHHQLTHDEPEEQPQVHAITVSIMHDFSLLLEALKKIPEGDSNVLNNSIILATSDVSYGRTHQIDEYPILLAGTGGGVLKPGVHYRSESKENASRVPLTVLQAMGISVDSYGNGDAFSDAPLTEIWA